MLLYQIAIEVLVDERWRVQDCDNNKLVSNKLNILKKKYKKAKGDFVKVIQACVY